MVRELEGVRVDFSPKARRLRWQVRFQDGTIRSAQKDMDALARLTQRGYLTPGEQEAVEKTILVNVAGAVLRHRRGHLACDRCPYNRNCERRDTVAR